MSDKHQDDWPPIISAANRPRWVIWRGIAITAFMWGLFFFIVERELEIAWQALRLLAGQRVERVDIELAAFVIQMKPALWAILLLVAVLGVATLLSRRRRNELLLLPRPVAAPDCELASDIGLVEQELVEIRRQKIVALDVDEHGSVAVIQA